MIYALLVGYAICTAVVGYGLLRPFSSEPAIAEMAAWKVPVVFLGMALLWPVWIPLAGCVVLLDHLGNWLRGKGWTGED